MSKAMEHVRYLVDVVGYRAPTSEGERWASKYIKGVMEKLGIEHQVEKFQSVRTFSFPYMAILAASILGGFLSCSHWFLGFLLSVAGAAAFYMESTCRGLTSRILPTETSQNVVGRIPAKEEARRRVVLTAHYDTSRTGYLSHPRLVRHLRTLVLLTTVAVLGMPILIILKNWSLFGFLKNVSILGLIVAWVLLLQREVYGLNVYGANDNASGTGVMLSLAEKIAEKQLRNTELWVVATGCEEAGLTGMLAFLHRHEAELRDALIVNLDNIGAGQIKYVTGEGLIQAYPSDPELLMLCAEVVRENPEMTPVPQEYRNLPTDAFAALVQGYRAMTIIALDEDGTIPNWHWETDVIENLEEENLEQVMHFVETLLNKIDSEKP